MIKKFIEVHKSKHTCKFPELKDSVRNVSTLYCVELEFESEDKVALPSTNDSGLRFVLNTPLTKEEIDMRGLVKTLKDGHFEPIKTQEVVDKEKHNKPLLYMLKETDNGLKVIRMLEDQFDGRCNDRLQEYIDKKKELRKKLK